MTQVPWASVGDVIICRTCHADPWWREGVVTLSSIEDFVCWDCEARIVGDAGLAVVKFPPEWLDQPY